MKCVKYLLFIFNLVFTITGLALIVIGGIIQGLYSQYLDFLGDQFLNTPVLLVVVGCLIFIVTFFGCCGAIKEHYCMTMTFSVLLAFIFFLEFGAGIAAYMLRNDVDKIVDENMGHCSARVEVLWCPRVLRLAKYNVWQRWKLGA